MTKDTALRLALEALENLGNHDHVCPQWPTYAEPENYPKCNCGYDQAITAIKAALEAKDEPVADHFDCGTYIGSHIGKEIRHSIGDDLPPQRTWVGLTDEEVASFDVHAIVDAECVRAIEAKLKEKNT